MSKRLFTLLQTAVLLGSLTPAFAQNVTADVYEYGRPVGTATYPARQYPNAVGRMNGTGVTLMRQTPPNMAERQAAAQRRVDDWNKQDDVRRANAQAQQDKWRNQFDERQAAAQRRVEDWNKQDDVRRAN